MTHAIAHFRQTTAPVPLVALAGWLLPGSGYLLIGERVRGVTIGVTIIALYLLGLFIAGVRLIEVPGYDNIGAQVRLDANRNRIPPTHRSYDDAGWALTSGGLVAEIVDKPWFVPQIVAGPITLASASFSVKAAQRGHPRVHARLADIGTLYTAIAGMLNLLAILDSSFRAGHLEKASLGNRST